MAAVGHVFHDKTSGRSIDARVIVVFSTADRKVIRVQREKEIVKIKAELLQIAAIVSIGRRVQGAVGNSSIVSAFSEACGVAGVSDNDGFDDVLSVAAYVPSEHSPGRSSSG